MRVTDNTGNGQSLNNVCISSNAIFSDFFLTRNINFSWIQLDIQFTSRPKVMKKIISPPPKKKKKKQQQQKNNKKNAI